MSEAANADQREYWNREGGSVWVEDQARFDEMLAPFATAVLDAAGLGADTTVIDLGCGTGALTLAAAARAGHATGLDISVPMIDAARRRAEREGVTNARFDVCDAQADPLPSADVAVSRFGVMFFEDPIAAFANVRRAIAPSGRLVFVCWQGLLVNEWMTLPTFTAAEHVPLPDPPAPGTPGPFSLGDEDHLRAVLDGAGFADVAITPFTTTLLLGGTGSVEDAVPFLERTGMGRTMLSEASPEALTRVREGLATALAPHHDGTGVRLGAATWIVTCTP